MREGIGGRSGEGTEVLENSEGSVTVYTDSQWSKNVIEKTWRAQKNRDLLEQIWSRMEGRVVRLRWVRGHNGQTQNERADLLANNAAHGYLR